MAHEIRGYDVLDCKCQHNTLPNCHNSTKPLTPLIKKMKFGSFATILLITLLTMISSCSGRNATHNIQNTQDSQHPALSIGNTVTEMNKGIMIVFQDKNNNYWFAGNGVYKYDGKSLTHFTMKDGLSSNSIRGIQEDKLGNMYFDSGGSISKFDGLKFVTLTITESNDSNNVWKLEPDDLWFVGTSKENGTYRYDGKSLYHLEFPKHELEEEFNTRYPNASFSPYGIYTLCKDRKGNVWFGTSTLGACRYDGKTFSWISEDELTELDDGPAPGVRSILEDEDGNIWFSNNILHRYKINEKSTTSHDQGSGYEILKGIDTSKEQDLNNHFMSIAEDKNGDLWMVTYDNGVWKYDGENLTHYPIKEGDTNVNIFSIYKDNQGDLWLCTPNAGAYKYNGKAFEKFVP